VLQRTSQRRPWHCRRWILAVPGRALNTPGGGMQRRSALCPGGRACSRSQMTALTHPLGGAGGYMMVASCGDGATASTASRSITVSTWPHPVQVLWRERACALCSALLGWRCRGGHDGAPRSQAAHRHPDRGSCARSQVQVAAAPEGGMARAPALQAESLRRRRGGAHMPRSQRTPDNGGLRCRQAVQSAPHASWPDRCRPQGARGALRCPTEAGHSILKAQVGLR